MAHSVILLAHGSRDPLWRQSIEAVAARMAALAPEVAVRCAYLELCTPTLAEAAAELVARGALTISVLPMFLGVGKHAREDMPRLMDSLRQQYPSVDWQLQTPIGEQPQVVELMARLALDSLPPA